MSDLALTCGQETGALYFNVSNLVCAQMSSTSKEEMWSSENPYTCLPIAQSISRNLIRVAATRIFVNKFRSVIEPISNSIDAYLEQDGKPGIGKFGMGWFSLFALLNSENSIIIQSTYMLPDSRICNWKSTIRKTADGQDYEFNIEYSTSLNPNVQTCTVIILENMDQLSENDGRSTLLEKIHQLIEDSYFVYNDIPIYLGINEILIGATPYAADNGLYDSSVKTELAPYTKDVLSLKYGSQSRDKIVNVKIQTEPTAAYPHKGVIIVDRATGISLDVFINKMMIPTVSGKTALTLNIDTDIYQSRTGVYENYRPVRGTHRPERRERLNVDCIMICVGKVGYTIQGSKVREPSAYDGLRYVLDLPPGMPMPVSRDDILLDNPESYSIMRKYVFILADKVIEKRSSIAQFLDILNDYATYSMDHHFYSIMKELMDYLLTIPSIYMVPEGYEKIYSYLGSLPQNNDIFFIPSSFYNLERLKSHFFNGKYQLVDNVISMKTLVLVPGLYKLISSYTAEFGIMDLLLVDTDFAISTKNNDEFAIKIIQNSEMILRTHEQMNRMNLNQILDTLFTVVLSSQNYSKLMEASNIHNFADHILSPTMFLCNPEAVQTIISIIYNSLLKSCKRDIPNRVSPYMFIRANVGVYQRLYTEDSSSTFMKSLRRDRLCIELVNYYFNFVAISEDSLISIRYVLNSLAIMSQKRSEEELCLIYDFLFGIQIQYVETLCFVLSEITIRSITKEVLMSTLRFAYNEIYTRYSINDMNAMYKYSIETNDILISPVRNYLLTTLIPTIEGSIILSDVLPSIPLEFYPARIEHKFTAKQLIGYVFKHDVSLDSHEWLSQVGNYPLTERLTAFRTLETAINDGVSRPYTIAAISEICQNAIDITRTVLTERRRRFAECGKYCKYGHNIYNQIDKLIDRGKISKRFFNSPKCDTIVEITAGESEDGNFELSITDPVGMNTRAAISILIPFLSSKSAEDIFSAGEMGTGFMTVYRQPWCAQVLIKSINVQTETVYQIRGIPLTRDNRVYDIEYDFQISNYVGNDRTGSTTIQLIYNKSSREELLHHYLDSVVYPARMYHSVAPDFLLNGRIISNNRFVKTVETENLVGYLVTADRKVNSVLLTSGVPYSDLESVILGSGISEPGNNIHKYSLFNIIIDMKRGSYTPVQTRKRFLLEDKIKDEIRQTVAYLALAYFYYDNKMSVMGVPYNEEYHGYSCDGCYNQHRPNTSDHSSTRYNGKLMMDWNVPLYNFISTGNLISLIIDYMNATHYNGKASEIVDNQLMVIQSRMPEIKIPEFQIELIKGWFKHKDSSHEEYTTQGKVEVEISTETLLCGKYLELFYNNIISYAWNIYRLKCENGTIEGLPCLIPQAPTVSVVKLNSFILGTYNPKDHVIKINVQRYGTEEYLDSIRKLKTISPLEVSTYIRTDPHLSNLISSWKIEAQTLIHEFFHALTGNVHTQSNSHGDYKYTLNGTKHHYNFDKAANFIWKYLLADFDYQGAVPN